VSCLPKVPCRGEVENLAVLRTGCRGDTSAPEWELQSKFRLTCVNVHGISELRGRSEKWAVYAFAFANL
jgi:hypothetical protein